MCSIEDTKGMQRLRRDPKRLETLQLFTMLISGDEKVLFSQETKDVFLNEIGEGLQQALSSRSTIHGFRTQYLFENMVASIGKAKLIKKEDAGETYISDDDIRIPDFRVVTVSGQNMLIEVKNYYQADPREAFCMRPSDIVGLKKYASIVGTPLKIAIYWAQWNLWTLNDPDDFDANGALGFPDAMQFSEMITLGDYMISTEFPIQMILYTDKTKPRNRVDDGFTFIIGGSEFRTAGRLIESQQEKNLAFFFMLNGTWREDEEGPSLELDQDGLPEKIIFTFRPAIEPDGQSFASIGHISQLFSNHFNRLTLDGAKVIDFGRDKSLAFLSSLIPQDYQGQALRLWRFYLQKGERKA